MNNNIYINEFISRLGEINPKVKKDITCEYENKQYKIYIANSMYFTSIEFANTLRELTKSILYKNNIVNFEILYKRPEKIA